MRTEKEINHALTMREGFQKAMVFVSSSDLDQDSKSALLQQMHDESTRQSLEINTAIETLLGEL